jgi:hypothetical protein
MWEHVNGANTLDGSNYTTMNGNACGTQTTNDWNSFTNNPTTDGVRQCNFSNGYTYANVGPKITNLNASNGIGRIWAIGLTSPTDRVFLRGGLWGDNAYDGIFTLYLLWISVNAHANVGFRCAR